MNLDMQLNHALRPKRIFVINGQEVDNILVHEDDDRGNCGAARIKSKRQEMDVIKGNQARDQENR